MPDNPYRVGFDATSKAARVTLYDASGRELRPVSTGSYCRRWYYCAERSWSGLKLRDLQPLGVLTND